MKNPLKIVLVSVFPEELRMPNGGVEAAAEILVDRLVQFPELDIQVIGISSIKKEELVSMAGYKLHWLGQPKIKLPGFLAYWTVQRRLIQKKIKELEPDVVHFQGVAGWGIGYKKPFVLTIHGINENDVLHTALPFKKLRAWLVGFIETIGRRAASKVIIINPYVVDQLSTDFSDTKVFIENPVADEYFGVERETTSPNILCVARVIPRKNIDGLIQAFARVKKTVANARLNIAGPCDDLDYFTQCQDLVGQLGLNESVCFLGGQGRSEIKTLLSHAGCLALVSWQETAPIVISEAMAAGVPVVASKVCGMPYMVDEGITGFLVDAKNEQQIADRLVDALQLGTVESHHAFERFNSQVVAERTLEVYKTVVSVGIK